MNLGEVLSTLYDRLGYDVTPDSSITRRLRRFVNLSHREILSQRQLSKLRRMPAMPFTCTANSPFVVLPQAVVHIAAIADRTNRRVLDEISLQDLRYRDPGLTYLSSIPDSYVLLNYSAAVAQDPSVASQLFVISDSAQDGTGLNAFVEGTITGGYPRTARVSMSGLTGVAIDSNATWEHITKFYVSAPASGTITLRQTSGAGTELARITQGRSYARYTQLHLSDTPASAITYYADVELRISDMLSPSDEPLLPEDFHYLLECGALRREYAIREKIDLVRLEMSNWNNGLRDLKVWMARKGNVSTGPNRTQNPRRMSQLGSNFPAGS